MRRTARQNRVSGCSLREKNYSADVMTRQQVLDLYFMDARSRLIDLAAFIDRVERSSGEDDFRMKAFREAVKHMSSDSPERAKQVLLAFSDPTTEPIVVATTKAACGAFPGEMR